MSNSTLNTLNREEYPKITKSWRRNWLWGDRVEVVAQQFPAEGVIGMNLRVEIIVNGTSVDVGCCFQDTWRSEKLIGHQVSLIARQSKYKSPEFKEYGKILEKFGSMCPQPASFGNVCFGMKCSHW